MKVEYKEPQMVREISKLIPGTVVTSAGEAFLIVDDVYCYTKEACAEGPYIPCIVLSSGQLTLLPVDTVVTPRIDAVLIFEGDTSTT